MAKGNDGNYLQHCVEVEAAVRLAWASADGRLHVALTHGMAPFEQIDEPKGNVHRLLEAMYNVLHSSRRLIVTVALMLLANSAHAEPGPIGQWLMNDPLTLWDHGMMRAENEADEAAKRVAKKLDIQVMGAWVYYSWDDNEITISMTVLNFPEKLSHANCNEVRRFFIAELIGLGPSWGSATEQGASIDYLMHYKIGDWFSHRGFQRGDRDEELSEKLARIIFVRVLLISGSNLLESNGFFCRARIAKHDAPSQPYSLSD